MALTSASPDLPVFFSLFFLRRGRRGDRRWFCFCAFYYVRDDRLIVCARFVTIADNKKATSVNRYGRLNALNGPDDLLVLQMKDAIFIVKVVSDLRKTMASSPIAVCQRLSAKQG
jgi:hypothetical protein